MFLLNMKFIISILLIGMDRVAPESMDNSAMFPFLTSRNLNERNIVMCTYLNCNNKSLANKEYCSKHQRAYNRRDGSFDGYKEKGESHNLSKTPEYKIWAGMRTRCNNPKDTQYKYYGGRAISVCKEWDSFLTFLDDMGQKPFSKAQIDRVDNNGNYCKENCRWTTNAINNRHTSRTKLDNNKVAEIRQLYSTGQISMAKIAKLFGVAESAICRVVNNVTWQGTP